MIDKNLVLVAARHTPTALKEPCVWQHQTAESVADLPQDERVFAGDLCVFAASDGTKTAFRYEHYWECDGEKKFDVYAPEVISDLGTVTFTKDGEELEELAYGDTATVTVTADSGYQVKTITLNGEEIENGAEITVEGDILLIAEFEEAGEDVVWEDDVTFIEGEGFVTAIVESVSLQLDTTNSYTFTCGEQTVTGKFAINEGSYILGEIDGFGIAYLPDMSTIQIVGTADMFDVETTYHAKLIKSAAPAPSAE